MESHRKDARLKPSATGLIEFSFDNKAKQLVRVCADAQLIAQTDYDAAAKLMESLGGVYNPNMW